MRSWMILATLIFILAVFFIFVYALDRAAKASDDCLSLGCEEGNKYVSSTSSNEYYECFCYYEKRLEKKDLICFKTKEEANALGKIFVDCG